MNPTNQKVVLNPIVATAQVGIPSYVLVDNTNGVHCPHGHSISPRSSYVSFRLAGALPNTHAWGLYVSQHDVVDLSATLQSAGWDQSTSLEAANKMIISGLTSIFHLDCTLMNVHEIMFLQFGNSVYQNGLSAVIDPSHEAICLSAGNAVAHMRGAFTGNDDDWYALFRKLGIYEPSPNRRFLDFTRLVIENTINNALYFSSNDARHRFILNLPVHNNTKPFPGLDLPVTTIP
jgi:hypothetical protein